MVFTHLCRAAAVLAAFFGILKVVTGFILAVGQASLELVARYTTASSTGEVIDKGLLTILAAIVLGTLAEISFSVRNKSQG